MALSTATHLQNFSSSQTKLLTLPISPFPQSLATTILLSVSTNLTLLSTSIKWNHRICMCPFMSGFFHLECFQDSSMLYHVSQFHSFLRLNNILVCIYHILLIHSWIDGHLACFHFLAIMSDACVQLFVWTYVFNSLGYIPRSTISGSYGNSAFNFLRNHQTFFHSGYSTLYSHKQCMRIPVSLLPHQHF